MFSDSEQVAGSGTSWKGSEVMAAVASLSVYGIACCLARHLELEIR